MDSIQIRETLEKQLQLLSERSTQEVTTAPEKIEIRSRLKKAAEKEGKSLEEYIGAYEKTDPEYGSDLKRLVGLSAASSE